MPNPSRPKTKYEKKINFAEVKRTFETHEENLVEELKPVLIKMRDSLIKDVINDTIIERKDFGDARKVEVRHLTEFRKTWDKHLKKMGSEGATEAKKELQKGEEQFQVTTPETLTRKESIDYIKNKSFQITNVESDFINNRVRMTLANAIRDGDSVKDVASEIGKIFDNYGLTEFAEGEKPLGIKPARLNTIARTELADAFNVGQKTIFEASDIVQAYQYSAVLDDRTTEFCAAQDGRIYKTDDPYADLIWPPNHFNCRSLFIPVVEGETFKVNDRLDIEETSPGSKFWRLKK